jgi:DNA replication licensing factor MCM3
VEIIVEDDLVDCVKPGDRVEVAGIYKAIAPAAKGSISGVFRAIVCGISVKKLTKEIANNSCTKGVCRPLVLLLRPTRFRALG